MAKINGHCAPKQNPITMEATYSPFGTSNAIIKWPTQDKRRVRERIKGRGNLYFVKTISEMKPEATRPRRIWGFNESSFEFPKIVFFDDDDRKWEEK
uniref:Uncharacterized protein n=1 Tax=Cucumis melo TaxID=3656 RepID=A0A9I9EI22_CUCME